MSLLSNAWFDVRRGLRPALSFTAIACTAFFIIIALIVGVFWLVTGQAKPPTSPLDTSIPITAVGPSVVQVFDCVRAGDECPYFEKSKEFLIAGAPSTGLVYTPLKDDDPGTLDADGNRVIRLSTATTPQEWAAVGRAVTLNGKASEKTVTEKTVTQVNAQTVTYPVPGTNKTGTIVLSLSQSSIVVVSVTYAETR